MNIRLTEYRNIHPIKNIYLNKDEYKCGDFILIDDILCMIIQIEVRMYNLLNIKTNKLLGSNIHRYAITKGVLEPINKKFIMKLIGNIKYNIIKDTSVYINDILHNTKNIEFYILLKKTDNLNQCFNNIIIIKNISNEYYCMPVLTPKNFIKFICLSGNRLMDEEISVDEYLQLNKNDKLFNGSFELTEIYNIHINKII